MIKFLKILNKLRNKKNEKGKQDWWWKQINWKRIIIGFYFIFGNGGRPAFTWCSRAWKCGIRKTWNKGGQAEELGERHSIPRFTHHYFWLMQVPVYTLTSCCVQNGIFCCWFSGGVKQEDVRTKKWNNQLQIIYQLLILLININADCW